ncbi:MAG: hypothetical protein COU09_02985 [Candidatus Harrisonbacteria bacterium CG10_big_fil_rev_8_21_14_0_10_44_23]|uniref:Uncharacterized protein n=1 Tax=Candidatus Harrisonbacteria bacterium CG10_big_fil_rev_8_21_14_0_10_44_23 TaxID=1974585 RepID=A0A2H0URK6_9BACT|nr:MAG: hypothetical protein COU09_02985 [Candidatus Harrisonbacteria bacterium CG10_big_fil_rev_8_21_14_0_10_44_23]
MRNKPPLEHSTKALLRYQQIERANSANVRMAISAGVAIAGLAVLIISAAFVAESNSDLSNEVGAFLLYLFAASVIAIIVTLTNLVSYLWWRCIYPTKKHMREFRRKEAEKAAEFFSWP